VLVAAIFWRALRRTSLFGPPTVAHYPPGKSTWNKIEHRMFCHITQNWRGRRWRA
jgi:hypothetical protein